MCRTGFAALTLAAKRRSLVDTFQKLVFAAHFCATFLSTTLNRKERIDVYQSC